MEKKDNQATSDLENIFEMYCNNKKLVQHVHNGNLQIS